MIDGHTRLSAALKAHLRKVPVIYKSFTIKEEAMDYAVALQFNRRNLDDADLLSFVLTLDTDNLSGSGRKQEKLSRVCNTSGTKAMRILKVKKDATLRQRSQILDGTLSVNSVYNRIIKNRDQVNPQKPSQMKQSKSVQIDVTILEGKVDDWINLFEDSNRTDLFYLQKVEAVLEILPEGPVRSSLSLKLPDA